MQLPILDQERADERCLGGPAGHGTAPGRAAHSGCWPGERRTGVLPRSGDSNAKPTGGTRQVTYKLVPGEAMWQLKPVYSAQF
ncbi:hypothetical protein [Synechococcus sp. CS-205]|uniref:hypothetical protein n=1 Tax=Synechococcus sp. CS-205 TaxID=2847984 RepID=UPI0018CCB58F|nr:hypothetical protein [Synechococcus sp. CS-205]MCT0249560.1 hypothetical protein [Synechococcus sp. CS-205]QPN62609.1 hypothetical protein H8F25_13105 [Synechococcus sp. CBW1004]